MMKCFQRLNKKLITILILVSITLFSLLVVYQNKLFLRIFPEKIWIHRVNSIEKRDAVAATYSGLELDVDFINDSTVFDVNHPPAISIGLNLIDYLSDFNERDDLFFWLDFKNLSMRNAVAAVNRLDIICDSLELDKTKVIVEAFVPEALCLFSNSGYKTSYYLAPDNYKPTSDEVDEVRDEILRSLEGYPTSYISFDRRYYSFIRKNIPDYPILTWGFYEHGFYGDNDWTFKSFLYAGKALFDKFLLLVDKDVVVVLFSYDAGAGNR